MRTEPTPSVFVIGPTDLLAAHEEAVLGGAAVAKADVIVLEVTGPAAVQCLQGVLTNDIEAWGNRGFVYGAILTPKGMIICDMWVAREEGHLSIVAPSAGAEALLEVFKRTLPPRLARVTDRTEELVALRIAGSHALITARDAGFEVPDAGTTIGGELAGIGYAAARPPLDLPFALQLTCARADYERLIGSLVDTGAARVDDSALELGRIMTGWPRLGAEIDQKTLPQEARYDEIDGVSYTKGCYTGQETVARLHFRGHTNRRLAGLLWEATPDPTDHEIVLAAKSVGRVTSVAWLHGRECYVGLGMIRNTAQWGDAVLAAGAAAKVYQLPFKLDL